MKKIIALTAVAAICVASFAGCSAGVKPNEVHSKADLVGKTIGVQQGTTGDTEASKVEGATIDRYKKGADAIQALKQGKVDAVETPIGYVPNVDDINIEGLDITKETIADLLSVDKELWLEDCNGIKEFYAQVGERVPSEFYAELEALESRLSK